MNIMINRPGDSRRHVYQLSGTQASGKSDFLATIALISERGKVARMTGAEFASQFSSKDLEGKEVLLIEGLMPDQRGELETLVTLENIKVDIRGKDSYAAPNTIKYIFYVLSDYIPKVNP